ncbi:MAG: nuclear transport factor 2 family protein [Rhodospirillaceae bacterium]|jgi:ketosteroid isomerase-like protein|nr:nuclear transport factor 2 family protein [Rhodospirillaceae bacterium]MBT6140335.1 nuclear transport factor 2 family protein [Rhodospirillaceae bacterium]
MDAEKRALMDRFSPAFNSNDVTGAQTCATDDFVWIFYEGSDSPHARIIKGVAAGCQAVVERAERSSVPIRFTEPEDYQVGDKVFVTYRASGEFKDSGPFDVRAVDIYTFRDGLLASKDTYWKKIFG